MVPTIGAIVAAVVAARSASRTKAAELRATRTLAPEHRKAEVFEGLAEAIEEVWRLVGDDKATTKAFERGPMLAIRRFMHWVQIYGSDEAVRTSSRYMQAIYHNVPPIISMRQLADLIIVARRELGLPATGLEPLDVLAFWVTDVYDDPKARADLTDPIEDVYRRHGWSPPWQ
ncbi:MAG TPA: hypothetical protein VGH79_07640 [Gaiellaceae bacterium]|jgi:hypothetical protein